jgi:hypothetical protein
MNRTTKLLGLRPSIVTDTERTPLTAEAFQNEVLRPLLAFQHEWIMTYFTQKLIGIKVPTDPKDRLLFVEQLLRKDTVIRNQLIGSMLGLLSVDELSYYMSQSTALNKRITQMLIQRIQSAF